MGETDAISALLSPGTNPNDMMDGLLADLSRQNPTFALVSQMLAMQRQSAAAHRDGPDHEDGEIAGLRNELARAQSRVEKLTALNRRLESELEAAYERVADAAVAVGACGLCWGEDPRCRSCRGRGKPGRFAFPNGNVGRFVAEATSPDGARSDQA